MSPTVSIVVPTRNRPEMLEETLVSLLAQDLAADQREIVVVDDGSEPPAGVPDGVRLVRHDVGRGPNAARNTGLKETSGELVVFIDDDVEMPRTWLSALVAASGRHPSSELFGGPIRLKLDAPARVCADCPTGEWELDLGGSERQTERDVYSGNMMIRRSVVSTVGEFAEGQPIYFDEVEWQHRLRSVGKQAVYVPDAWLWHKRMRRDMRVSKRVKRGFRVGYGRANFFASTGQPLELPRRLLGIPGLLLHSARRRCVWGVLATSGELGGLWWAVEHRYRRGSMHARRSLDDPRAT